MRYIVRACDNGDCIEGLARQRTWDVICQQGGQEWTVASFLTRREAHTYKRELQGEVQA